MKFRLIIDCEREEEVVVYAHEKTPLVCRIEELAAESEELLGYSGKSIVKLTPIKVFAFATEDGKVVAFTEKEKLYVNLRLYQLEKMLGSEFVKINQSCLVNVSKIERFEATIGASLMVVLKNGYRDYVSRRQVKFVKERMGFKR